MTSILNNAGAMVALSTLSTINRDLLETQSAISTGKTVASSADDSAIWAVTTIMDADVDGFNAISDSLSLGKATVTVARNASEKITDLLREVKEKVITANGENVDRAKIQTDIDELTNQVSSIVAAAQFNGLNLIDGSSTTSVSVLSSLDRGTATVSSSSITVNRQDLGVNAGTTGASAIASSNSLSTTEMNASTDGTVQLQVTAGTAASTFNITVGSSSFTYTQANTNADQTLVALAIADAINNQSISGVTATAANGTVLITNTNSFASFNVESSVNGTAAQLNGASTTANTLDASSTLLTLNSRTVAADDGYSITLTKDTNSDGTNENFTFDYIARSGDTLNDVANGLKEKIEANDFFNDVSIFVDEASDPTVEDVLVKFDVSSSTIGIASAANSGGTRGGGLGELGDLLVTTNTDATNALTTIEGLIQTAVDAAAAFGSSEKRLEIQEEFVTSLVDSMKTGIGALVDTDMESASARLQALQVQQQLGTQSLSIANSAPQNILSLFR
ncbi:MAG: flagellin [Neomegalonema sp.]|nr:flagellin [Neomegalonema sp.]